MSVRAQSKALFLTGASCDASPADLLPAVKGADSLSAWSTKCCSQAVIEFRDLIEGALDDHLRRTMQ